jgi:hypothetical protein
MQTLGATAQIVANAAAFVCFINIALTKRVRFD